ncbi:glycosyl hydrolase family 81 [Colletotrichum karsti]|uniref:glucan endo-1,3-beta-D-glucosidase n=1 Tax=Colletotrichum karsti TaxID=1095194 RepID=A0A9P6LKR2_9PEZI|nr:glycosyl hydrolase family 81 [Colletotrichum karsti]KAF9876345.1 glycosyl hydrolase family 81 [Colletotrichum karsti]
MAGDAPTDLYPRYCLNLSPTSNTWCLMHAIDIHALRSVPDFEVQDFYFYKNLPIKWVRIVGIVVAVDDFPGRRIYTLDDSSGACIECTVPMKVPATATTPKGIRPQPQPPADCVDVDVGSVLDVKGMVATFREERQIKIEKVKILRCTEHEVALWERRTQFKKDVLSVPWVLTEKQIRRCKREEERENEGDDERRRRKEKKREEEERRRRGSAEAEVADRVFFCQSALALFHQQHVRLHISDRDSRSVGELSLHPRLLDIRDTSCLTETTNTTVTVRIPKGAQTPGSGLSSGSSPTATAVQSGGNVVTLPALTGQQPQTTGDVHSNLDTNGKVTTCPLISDPIPSPTTLIEPSSGAPTAAQPIPSPPMASGDLFSDPIGTAAPPPSIQARSDHPVPRKGIASSTPLQTNKFYANFFLGDQTAPTYTYPYGIAWGAGKGAAASFGMTISHIDANQIVFGPPKDSGAAAYYINPVGIQSMVISALELGSDTAVGVDSITAFSARIHLKPSARDVPAISFPLVQGMPFITAQYAGATPVIRTGVFFRTVTRATQDPKAGVAKYTFQLEDGKIWRVYGYATTGEQLDLQVVNNGLAQSTKPFFGTIQIAKDPGNGEAVLDQAAGVFPTTVELSGSVNGNTGTYGFKFAKEGHQDGKLAMYALPHHIASFDATTRAAVQQIYLQTPAKGSGTLVVADQWTMVEPNLPVNMNFAPWSPVQGSLTTISEQAKTVIRGIAAQEVSQDMNAQSDLDSMYFSGKALAKFAILIVAINDIVGDTGLAQSGLIRLKEAFSRFATNKQKFPLLYESAWGGIVSSATYVTGNDGADFGNTNYNDHHFHYGYHILAAAAIAHLDPAWMQENKDYVNALIRDFANPSTKDTYFPTWRSFDWYHGHSWAHGLYASFDGKNQESSSEDMMAAYAIKMWGEVSGDSKMAMRGNLQLTIIARALQSYYLYKSDNAVQPPQFIGNKVAGILFENKVDHTTFFGANIEYIQGIHMVPLLAPSPFIRTPDFVREEWDVYFSNGRVDSIVGGWRGILYGNLATIDSRTAFDFFNSPNFDPGWIDGGASLTWYLTYAAGKLISTSIQRVTGY